MAEPIYRTTGVWGVGKGSNLTREEVDGNFWALVERIVALETGGEAPVGIANITVVGTQMTIILTDATELGPYTLPTAHFVWRDEWTPNTVYGALNVFTVGYSVYLVNVAHESAATFDPDRVIGANPAYILMLTLDQYSAGVITAEAPFEDDAYNVTITDNHKYIRFNGPFDTHVTVNLPNGDVPLPIGAEIRFRMNHAGSVEFAGNIWGIDGYNNRCVLTGGVVTAVKVKQDDATVSTEPTGTDGTEPVEDTEPGAALWEIYGDLELTAPPTEPGTETGT